MEFARGDLTLYDCWADAGSDPASFVFTLKQAPQAIQILEYAMSTLMDRDWWLDTGTQSPDVCAEIFSYMFSTLRKNPMLGAIVPYAGTVGSLPPELLLCDGSTHAKADFPDLTAILDPVYSVDADHFSVPDLRGRTPVGVTSSDAALPSVVNQVIGESAHTLTISEIPGHTHAEGTTSLSPSATGTGAPGLSTVGAAGTTGSTGGGGAHNNVQPSIGVRYVLVAR